MLYQEFLKSVLGSRGATIVSDLFKDESARTAVVNRTILGWLENLPPVFHGCLPGTDTYVELCKSDKGYTGLVPYGVGSWALQNAPLEKTVALLSIHLNAPRERTTVSFDLAKLGYTLDRLIKAQNFDAPDHAQPAAHKEQIPPVAPTAPEVKARPKLPRRRVAKPLVAPTPPTITMTKAESQWTCPVCGVPQFKGSEFTGCYCFRGLRKHVRCSEVVGGFKLDFDSTWTQADVAVLMEAFGRK